MGEREYAVGLLVRDMVAVGVEDALLILCVAAGSLGDSGRNLLHRAGHHDGRPLRRVFEKRGPRCRTTQGGARQARWRVR